MSEATDELERLVEEAVPCKYASIKRQWGDQDREKEKLHPEIVLALQACTQERPCAACRKREGILAAIRALPDRRKP